MDATGFHCMCICYARWKLGGGVAWHEVYTALKLGLGGAQRPNFGQKLATLLMGKSLCKLSATC